LAALCETYWYPLYAHVRRRGYSTQDAQDLTQGFFAHLLERQVIDIADPERGRFRSFLLTAMNNYLATERERACTQKRGSDCMILSLDAAAAEERYQLELVDESTPDKAFDRNWAMQLLGLVLKQLEREYQGRNQADLFAALKQTLAGTRESPAYSQLAPHLRMDEAAIKVAVHRLRKRYRQLIRKQIEDTIAAPGDAESEMRYLMEALAG
jgi:RNA polymerase sigma-70 factor (ECF subfamily)